MNKKHTRFGLITAIALLTLTFGLAYSNRIANWVTRLATKKQSQSAESKQKTVLPTDQINKTVAAKAGLSPKPAADDADLPGIAGAEIDKEQYMEKRNEYINMLRGLPYPDDIPNPRVTAIRRMQLQEAVRPQAALGAWIPIGPAPIPNGQTTSVVTAVSGRVTAIDVHPTNPDIVYVGTAQGGLYRSLNGGTTWTPLMDNALSLAIGAVTINPSNPSMVFVGTGEANFSADSYFGVGLYIIQNADSNAPTLVGPLNKDASNADVFTNRSISRVLVDPTDANMVFVATASGTSGNPSSTVGLTLPPAGLYRSTNVLSANPTFTRLSVPTGAGITSRSISDATMEPGNPDVVNCVVLGTNAANDGGIWRSTNARAANPTFTRTLTLGTATGTLRADLAINKVGSVVTLIAATAESSTGRVRRSIDGGATWSAAIGGGSNGFCGGQCFYDNEPAISPIDANIIFLGGATIFLKASNGTTFAASGTGLHADHHAIVFAPSNPTIVYEGNDGGIYKSTDTGASWTSLNNSTFSATQFQSIAVHPRDRNFSLGGTQDNGTNFYRPDGTWIRADFGDGGQVQIEQNSYDNTNVTAYHTYFNQTNAMGYARITNTANAQENGWTFFGCGFAGTPNGMTCAATSILFYAPMAQGPGNPNTLYFGSDVLYRSSNNGVTMTKVSQEPIVSGQAITAIGISQQNDNVRIVGLRNGKVFATTSGSSSLTDVTSASFPTPARAVGKVAIDPNNSDTAYVTFLGFGVTAGQHIWKTTNLSGGAATWAAAGNGIPDVPVNAFVIDPANSNNLYAGTDIGVYQSTDGGANWIPFGTALPRVAVFDLAIQSPNRILRAATHGRGIYETLIPGVANPLATLEAQPANISAPIIDNGNGVYDPGEDGTITIPLKNVGQATATGITGTLTTSTPGVTILTGASAYPNIAAGATQNNLTQFVFRLTPAFVCGTKINFTLTFAYNDPASPRTSNFSLLTGSPGVTPGTFTYAGAPVAIPDNNATGITVPLNVSGLTGAVSSVKFKIGGSSCNTTPASTTVGLDHTFVGDLAIFLVSPTGTSVQLTPISGNSGVNLCQTVFDDAAATAFSAATAGQAPFTGSFRPVQPLSALIGENGNGQWSVKITDLGGGDVGSLRAFSLDITTASCAKANTLTTIASSSNPSIVGQAVTLTTTVAPAGAATGTVQFKDNGVAMGAPVAVSGAGTASITTSALAQGIHPITAEYSGDANFNASTGSLSQVVNRLVVSLADPAVCTGPGGVVAVTATVTNNNIVPVGIAFTASLPAQLLALPGTCTASIGSCTVVNASTVTVSATLAPGQTTTINYLTQIADGTTPNTQMCINSGVSFDGGPVATVQACTTANCPTPGPGGIFPATSEASDQGAGSVLIYNIYTSGATSGNTQNTRVNLTNIHPTRPAFVHLFFVSEGCSVADSYVCLTGNQTTSFLTSDLDPGTTGYLVAVAVDGVRGCPTNFNYLIGDEYVKFSTGHAANLGAEGISALAGGLPLCDGNSVTAQLDFNGIAYDQVSHVLALDNVGSRADGNDTLLILNRIGGNLGTGAGSLSSVFGIFYDDAENALSFTFSGGHQFRSSLSNNFPRITPRFETFIPAGRTGWFKLWPTTATLWGITGAAINFNANAASSSGAFNQGHNLHKLRLTNTANYIIPVFPPSC